MLAFTLIAGHLWNVGSIENEPKVSSIYIEERRHAAQLEKRSRKQSQLEKFRIPIQQPE
jgi:hypothetical protein